MQQSHIFTDTSNFWSNKYHLSTQGKQPSHPHNSLIRKCFPQEVWESYFSAPIFLHVFYLIHRNLKTNKNCLRNKNILLYFSLSHYLAHSILKKGTFLVAQTVKDLPAMQETWVLSLDQEDPLEKGMATHSNILAWRIPRTEEPGRPQSMELQRVRHKWATNTFTFILSK